MLFEHQSVLATQTIALLDIKAGHTVVDTTCGGGGHLMLMAEACAPNGVVIGIDRDKRALEKDAAGKVKDVFGDRVHLVNAPFSELPDVLRDLGISRVDRILCDLGVSSPQLDTDARGFSFMRDGPIDMRMSTDRGATAYELIQQLSETELANIIYQYGEERYSRRIARVIKEKWPLPDSTLALADVIARAVGRREKIHPATRTFQALRIAVNDELGEIRTLVNSLPKVLSPHGRAVFISFHSLEDRIIKHAFRHAVKLSKNKSYQILTKKPIVADDEEIKRNPRARSAKLRGLEKIAEEDLEGLLCEKTSP